MKENYIKIPSVEKFIIEPKNKTNYIFYNFQKYIFVIILFFINYSFNLINKTEFDCNTSNKSSINYMHLALNIDKKFLYPVIVYLTSLLDNRANSSFYFIHLLTNGTLAKKSIRKIKSVIDKFGNNFVKLIYHDLGSDFKDVSTGYLPQTIYYKIALPSLLPNVDKIIYTDSDMINLEDLTEMYSFRFDEKIYFAGTLDYINHLEQIKEFSPFVDKYINAGLLIMNLKAMREDSIEAKLREFISNHTLNFLEQTAINYVCRNNIQILPYKYGIFAFESFYQLVQLNNQQEIKYRYTVKELEIFFEDPTNFHYVSLDKPWLKGVRKFNKVYWWYYAKMSGFYKEILEYYNITFNEIEFLLKQIPNYGGLLKRNYKQIY